MNNIQYINENLALIQVLHKCVSSSRVQRDWVREYACTHITRAYTAACWSTVVHSCLLEYSRQETRIQATNTSCTKKMLLPGNHVATRLKLISLFDSWVAALFRTLFCYCQSSVLLRRPIDEDHAKYKKNNCLSEEMHRVSKNHFTPEETVHLLLIYSFYHSSFSNKLWGWFFLLNQLSSSLKRNLSWIFYSTRELDLVATSCQE